MSQISQELITLCADIADRAGGGHLPVPAGPDGLSVVCARTTSVIRPTLYQPMICLVLQGEKQILHRDGAVGFAAGQTAVVSHELVTGARIVHASPERPYVALACQIDADILRGLYAEIAPETADAARAEAVAAGRAEHGVIDALSRLLDLADKPLERRVLEPMVRRELHFRVLLSRHGGMLRQLAQPGSPASRIALAIRHIRQNWNHPIRMEDLAGIAGMSSSSFHAHFKAVTATSPVQYQKSLRLVEARQRLAQRGQSVSAVAFAIGYESPTQFSRDYRRAYGAAPRDLRA